MSRWLLVACVVGVAALPAGLWGQSSAWAEAVSAPSSNGALLDPRTLLPESSSSEGKVRALVMAGQRAAACNEATRAINGAVEPSLSRLRWHVGHQCDDEARADAALDVLSRSAHPLSVWARLDRAERQRKQDPAAALQTCSSIADTTVAAERARVIVALALVATQDPRAEQALREIVNASDAESGAATAAMPLAALLRARGDVTSQLEALSLYRRVASRAPLTSVGREALALSASVLSELPVAERAAHALPTVEDEQHRARALFTAHRHAESAQVYAAVAERVADDPTAACAARVSQLRALSRLRDGRDELVSRSDQVVAQCDQPDARAWSHYYAAQALARIGNPSAAIARFDQIAIDAPGHSLVDDALFKSAQSATDLGDEPAAIKRLRSIVDAHSDGDMRSAARFSLAWRARAAGDHATALQELEQLIVEGAGENAEGIEGRAVYWRARSLTKLDRSVDAVAAFRQLVLSAPLSYYGQQAIARLREIEPTVAQSLESTLAVNRADAQLRFASRAELQAPAFERALALLAVGEIERARQELSSIGAFGEGADPDMLWLIASLFDAADAPAVASRLARDRLRSFMSTAPRGRGFGMWRIGFPRAFSPVIDNAATEAGVPATFIRAVAREESAFDPAAVSSAGARGLIQLMESTAREHAKALHLPSDAAALHRPEVNVRVGANFMRYLWKRYADNPAIVPAAYNAGHGAADRWLAARGDQSLDEWIENIPYDETRRYTRRVLQSYGVYSMLDEGRLPALNATLPRAR